MALVTTLAVLLVACASFLFQQWTVARQQTVTTQGVLVSIMADVAAPALARRDLASARAAVDAAAEPGSVVSAQLIDASGKVIASKTDGTPKAGVRILAEPVVFENRQIGELRIGVVDPSLAKMLPRFLALTMALFFGAAGAALFLSRGLARRITAPVDRLSRAMEEVALSGQFKQVEEKTTDDGLFQSLARSFNQLLAKLEANDRSLRETMVALVTARDQADTANVAKSQFLANMSHEIRTPLNGVLAMADVMSRGDLDERQRERLGVIRESGELLLSVLNDVLDLSKIEAGKLELTPSDFDLSELADACRKVYGVMAQEKGLRFDLTIEADAAGAWRGDRDRMRQILGNLLSNAIKFTVEGAVAARFSLAPGGALRLTVADTGVGITPDKLPTLFDKFVQADNSTTRQFGGTGLGLAICRELAQLMGGQIIARSAPGEGSTFTVDLPLARGVIRVPEALPVSQAEEAEARPLRILAAEDNLTNQKVLRAVLDPLDIDLTITADGAAAVEAWRTGGFDLILMDIQMPIMDGVEATETIRAEECQRQIPRIPILALTANAMTYQVEQYLAVGMDGHVSKPIELQRLYVAIENALAGHSEATQGPGQTAVA
ncbi:ATP-binding protein [Caulobacter sp. NIBR1757]|uniref:ATP-binding protein n=1 Tax=Caulobacter sp. NIBR1757 TaxID=3016000 RepID=UPI0022F0EF74|nr:ATP-binding protein [Caulobacter sp. NIBR1757]WGM41227.1 Sensor histidine kinase RcsC [Caulobacter sp. NIBR1757]